MYRFCLPWIFVVACAAAFSGERAQGEPSAGAGSAVLVVAPEAKRPELKGAIEDIEHYLERITRRDVELDTALSDAGKSDVVLRLDPDAEALSDRNSEAYHLAGDGDGPVVITAATESGLAHGVYGYLRELGVEWLMPGRRWGIVPARHRIAIAIDRVDEPEILTRMFSCNGGFGGILAMDRDMNAKTDWGNWSRRIGYGGPERISGHAGEAFNLKHREQIEANPRWLALVDGERSAWRVTAKHCVSNDEIVELFVRDRLEAMERVIARDPDAPHAYAVSAEPADGAGHCQCEPCAAIGTVSDRMFYRANRVAEALARVRPDKQVSLLAYNIHADVPSIELHPNVFVMSVPYGFQLTGLTPERLLENWNDKVSRLGVYGYWANTDWFHDLPGFSAFNRARPQVSHWRELGIVYALLESTASGGAMGFNLWASSKLMWGDDRGMPELLDAYCRLAFGEAAEPMRRMMSRWHDDFRLSDQELGLSFRDLEAARAIASDPDVRARLDDMVRYVHHIRMYHEYESHPNGSEERFAAADRMIEHLWRIYDSRMVHSYRMFHLTLHSRKLGDSARVKEAWPYRDLDAPIWRTIKPYTSDELEALLADGLERFVPIDFERRRFSDDLVWIGPVPSDKPTAERFTQRISGRHLFAFHQARAGRVELDIEVYKGRGSYPGSMVTVTAPDGAVLFQEQVPDDHQWHKLAFETDQVGTHRVEVFDQGARFRFRVPPDRPFSVVTPANVTNLTNGLYFFVPKGQKKVALFEQGVLVPEIFDGDGNAIDIGDQRKLIVVPVPEGQDGRVWRIDNMATSFGVKLLNVPQSIAWSPEGLMVPREVKP